MVAHQDRKVWPACRMMTFVIAIALFASGCGSAGTADDRLAAEWAIKHGGTVVIADGLSKISSVEGLPADSFAVEKIYLNQVAPPITDKDLAELPTATGVKYLGLHYAQVTNKGLSALLAFRNLQELELSYTEVSDAGLQELTGLKSLKKLYLYGTEVTAEGIEAFAKKRPGCKVFRD